MTRNLEPLALAFPATGAPKMLHTVQVTWQAEGSVITLKMTCSTSGPKQSELSFGEAPLLDFPPTMHERGEERLRPRSGCFPHRSPIVPLVVSHFQVLVSPGTLLGFEGCSSRISCTFTSQIHSRMHCQPHMVCIVTLIPMYQSCLNIQQARRIVWRRGDTTCSVG